MGICLILTPVVVGGWPVITAAVAGAASALGLAAKDVVNQRIKHQHETEIGQDVEVELAESEILAQNLAADREIVLTKNGIELRLRRDERGRCSVCAKGKGRSKAELKQIAERFIQKMTQCFIYNRLASELKSKGFKVVNEEVMDDEAIRIHVRRWVD